MSACSRSRDRPAGTIVPNTRRKGVSGAVEFPTEVHTPITTMRVSNPPSVNGFGMLSLITSADTAPASVPLPISPQAPSSGSVRFSFPRDPTMHPVTVDLNAAGAASLPASFATQGPHRLMAVFSGNADYKKSSTSLEQGVTAAPPAGG